MGYNTTAAACPCSHPVKTRSASRHLHTISHHFSTYNQQFYQNMCCFLLSFHKIHVSFLSCYVRLPKPQQRTEVKKGLQFFLQMLCCSKMTQKTRVQTERICIMLTGKTIILGVTGGIAAYKAANLASLLKKQHADVHVIMTNNEMEFIRPLTF